MYNHIIVAVDNSDTSRLALNEAILLAKDQHTKLALVHIVDLSFAGEGGMWIGLEEYLQSVREAANLLINKLEKIVKDAGIKIETYLVEMTGSNGRIAEEIVAAVRRLHGDLLIIGTHGRSGFRRFLLGSIADEVIHIANTPILLVRGQEEEKKKN